MKLPEPDLPTQRATFGMSCFIFPEAHFGSTKGKYRDTSINCHTQELFHPKRE